jgi:hypothetical protein
MFNKEYSGWFDRWLKLMRESETKLKKNKDKKLKIYKFYVVVR